MISKPINFCIEIEDAVFLQIHNTISSKVSCKCDLVVDSAIWSSLDLIPSISSVIRASSPIPSHLIDLAKEAVEELK